MHGLTQRCRADRDGLDLSTIYIVLMDDGDACYRTTWRSLIDLLLGLDDIQAILEINAADGRCIDVADMAVRSVIERLVDAGCDEPGDIPEWTFRFDPQAEDIFGECLAHAKREERWAARLRASYRQQPL